jgi:uncharacterized protein
MPEDPAHRLPKSGEVTIASPCIRNCCLDEHDVCVGCHRTLSEILRWSSANDQQKREILQHCHFRSI